ncbi:MAG: FeoA domain-containing protein [Methylococcales bacterium]|nr:FeoA domain-containing protein [Methylococcales bacterium]
MSAGVTLQAGSECIIRSLGPDKKVAQRLAQMGVLPGSRLRVIRLAPFGETLEVSIDQGQYFALRVEEVNVLDCEMVAMPLSEKTLKTEQYYRIRSLSGGKTFQQRMEHQGVIPGIIIQIRELNKPSILIELFQEKKIVALGSGEAEKIIIEVIDDPQR